MNEPFRSICRNGTVHTLHIDLPAGQSAFLWGPRKTEKSTLLHRLFPRSAHFDLLDTRLLLEWTRSPWVFRERVQALDSATRAHPIVIDEVQKAPAILDEVHRLIETAGLRFVLCGSRARKLKRGQANLLGGRAWRFGLHPLTRPEIPAFDLLKALNRRLVPAHYNGAKHRRALVGYVQDYLKEEVFDEGLTRNVAAFARFFDALAFCHGELVNYSNVARDCGVDSKTVREYFQILVDTLARRVRGAVQPPPFPCHHHSRTEILSLRRWRRRTRGRPAGRASRRPGVRSRPRTSGTDGTAGVANLSGAGRPGAILAHQIGLGMRLHSRARWRGGD